MNPSPPRKPRKVTFLRWAAPLNPMKWSKRKYARNLVRVRVTVSPVLAKRKQGRRKK